MSELKIKYGTCIEDAPKVIMARVVGLSDTAITQSSLNALTYLVKQYASRADADNCVDGTTVVAETALTISACVFNTLQTDNGWTDDGGDSVGYNVKFTVPAIGFPTAGKWYAVEAWADPVSGDDFPAAIVRLHCKGTARD